jgi:DNA-binding NtrC family response regulator
MPTDPDRHDTPTRPLPPNPAPAPPREPPAPHGAGDVVVVDHDPEAQTRLARTLTGRGARVVATGSPDAALTLLSQWSPGLVLVSEALPGQGALALARKIREGHPSARVVLMTAGESPDPRAPADLAGVLRLLVKPLRLDALFDLLDFGALSPAG